jgi:hypothetical protein
MIAFLFIYLFLKKPLRSMETSKNAYSSTTVWLLEMSREKKNWKQDEISWNTMEIFR